jgi:hypothetical protein
MSSIQDDMREALNEFFKGQAAVDGKCLVDYVQFDTTVEQNYQDKPVKDAKAVLEPRGMTALYDGIGIGASALGKRLAALDETERPGTVIVVVVTDGYENASQEWSREAVKTLIETQESKYNWEFNFLGANMNAAMVGAQMGFKGKNTLTYSTAHTGATMDSLNMQVTRSRGGDKSGYTVIERNSSVGD